MRSVGIGLEDTCDDLWMTADYQNHGYYITQDVEVGRCEHVADQRGVRATADAEKQIDQQAVRRQALGQKLCQRAKPKAERELKMRGAKRGLKQEPTRRMRMRG